MYVALINRFNLSVFHAKNYTDIKENNLFINFVQNQKVDFSLPTTILIQKSIEMEM